MTLRARDQAQGDDGACAQAKGDHDDEDHVRSQKHKGTFAVFTTQGGEREITDGARRENYRQKRCPADFEGSGAEYRNFQRQGKRRNGGKKNSDQAVLFEPGVQALSGALGDVLGKKDLAAFARDGEQEGATAEGTGNGADCGEPSPGGMVGGEADQQNVDAGDDGNAR
jgi:hypothetical protein